MLAAAMAVAPQTLTGTVERVVYHDVNSRYTVMRLQVEGHEALVTAVGRTSGVEEGADVTVVGAWDEHPPTGDSSPSGTSRCRCRRHWPASSAG